MTKLLLRGLVVVGALSVLAIAAIPAHATITPAGATISASSTDSQLSAGGPIVRCPTSEFTGTINAAGTALSGRLAFSSNPRLRITCTESTLGSSVTVVCRGLITLRSDSSVAGVSASGTVVLTGATPFECSVTVAALGCTITIRGPQGPFNAGGQPSAWTFDQATQILTADVRTLRAVGTGLCPSSNASTFSGRYRVTSVNTRPVPSQIRLTIS